MEYKRLTKCGGIGRFVNDDCITCKQHKDDTTGCDFCCGSEYSKRWCCGVMYQRLAELEDKIENGTLIETEYPIYQDIYFIDYVDENNYSVGVGKGKPTIRYAFIHSVEQVMKGQILYLIQPHDLPQEVLDNKVEHTETWEWYHFSKKDLFLTKAEAEQKLRELNGEV